MFVYLAHSCRFKTDDGLHQIVMYVVSIGYIENYIFISKYQYLQYTRNCMLFSRLNL